MGRDIMPGKNLLKIAEETVYNYEKLIQLDKRFSMAKNINAGTPRNNKEKTNHVKMSLQYKLHYNKRDKD